MYLLSNHLTFLAINKDGLLYQTRKINKDCIKSDYLNYKQCPLLPQFESSKEDGKIFFKSNSGYICAENDKVTVSTDRQSASIWEAFREISEIRAKEIENFFHNNEYEKERFSARVLEMALNKEPIKLYFGCGEVPIKGFLNVDIDIMCPDFALSNPDDYFIFPYIGCRIPVDNNMIDYVFHEDLIEHVDQLSQFQFLSEILRILKVGGWHRVNTPNLLHAMEIGSNFSLGAEGVYTGELQWGHIALLTPGYLVEIAKLIGYRTIVFNKKGVGESPYMYPDRRPGFDRDELLGNIYADLQK